MAVPVRAQPDLSALLEMDPALDTAVGLAATATATGMVGSAPRSKQMSSVARTVGIPVVRLGMLIAYSVE
jgi:hypothetical protein